MCSNLHCFSTNLSKQRRSMLRRETFNSICNHSVCSFRDISMEMEFPEIVRRKRCLQNYRDRSNLLAITEVVLITILSRYVSILIKRPSKKTKTHCTFFDIEMIFEGREVIEFSKFMKKRHLILKKEQTEKSGKFWTKVKRTDYIHFLEDACEIYGIELDYEIPVADAGENWKCISRFRYMDLDVWFSVKENIAMFGSVHEKILRRFPFQKQVIIDEEFFSSKV